jgi:hypothetical protein
MRTAPSGGRRRSGPAPLTAAQWTNAQSRGLFGRPCDLHTSRSCACWVCGALTVTFCFTTSALASRLMASCHVCASCKIDLRSSSDLAFAAARRHSSMYRRYPMEEAIALLTGIATFHAPATTTRRRWSSIDELGQIMSLQGALAAPTRSPDVHSPGTRTLPVRGRPRAERW